MRLWVTSFVAFFLPVSISIAAYHPLVHSNSSSSIDLRPLIEMHPAGSGQETHKQDKRFPSPHHGRVMAERVVAAVEQLAARGEQNLALMQELRAKITLSDQEWVRLKTERAEAVKELAKGSYCSQCLRSKVEIEEEDGHDFNTHLRMVSAYPISAPLKKVAEKERQFDAKIVAVEEQRKKDLEEIGGLREENRRIFVQLGEGVSLWHAACALESELIRVKGKEEQETARKGKEVAAARLDDITSRYYELVAIGPPRPEAVEELSASAALWSAVSEKFETVDHECKSRVDAEAKGAGARKEGDRVRLHGALQRLFAASAADDYFAGYSPAGFSLEDANTEIGGAGFAFGRLDGDANNGNAREIAAFIALLHKLKKLEPDAVLITEPQVIADPPPVQALVKDKKTGKLQKQEKRQP